MPTTDARMPGERTPRSVSARRARVIASSRITVAWAMGGGVSAGGILVAAVALGGGMSSGGLPSVSLVLFLLGAAAGLVHGAAFAYLARDLHRTRSECLRGIAVGVILAVPGLILSWATSLWVSLSATAFVAGGPLGMKVLVVVGWIAALAMCAWAGWEGVRALGRVFRRWPEYRVASLVLAVAFAVLVVRFVLTRPEIWGTDTRVTGVGAIVLALGATVWLGIPAAVALLYAGRKALGHLPPSTAS